MDVVSFFMAEEAPAGEAAREDALEGGDELAGVGRVVAGAASAGGPNRRRRKFISGLQFGSCAHH
jgi:hypothetical protein